MSDDDIVIHHAIDEHGDDVRDEVAEKVRKALPDRTVRVPKRDDGKRKGKP